MAYEDMRALHEQARQQADAFMARSREQMALAVQDHQRRFPGVQFGGGFSPGGAGYPQSGTPAGRLMDTITDLTRRGAAIGGAPIGAAAGAAGQAFQFATGGQPFGPSGVWGGATTGAQHRMGFMQTLFTAYGENIDLPFPVGNVGRWAGQRLDMEKHQAQTMARDELQYRLERGTERAGWGLFDALSFGMASYQMRREGMGYSHVYSTLFARNAQTQGRFITRDALRDAGLAGYAGPFETGISHAGGRALGGEMAKELGFLEKEMGLSGEEAMALQNRAMGTMGITAITEITRKRGFGGLAQETGRQVRAVREIQQTLHLSEKEAQEFFDTMGQMYGTAERIVGMTREAKQRSSQWGINVRQVFEYMRGFEDFGRTTGLGQTRARQMGMEYIDEMRQQQRIGAMSREELMMYGGTTEEESLGIRAQTRLRQNIGLFRGGMLGGFEILAGARPRAYVGFMGGRMGAMEAAGAIGGAVAADPFARMRGRYDPDLEAKMGQDAMRLQFERVQQESRQGFFAMATSEADREAMEIGRFEGLTNLEPLQAAREYRMFARETGVFERLAAKTPAFKGKGRDIQTLYSEIRSRGLLGYITAATGKSSTYEAAADIYRMMGGPKGGEMTLDEALRKAGAEPVHAQATARAIADKAAPVTQILGAFGEGLRYLAMTPGERAAEMGTAGGRVDYSALGAEERGRIRKAMKGAESNLPEMMKGLSDISADIAGELYRRGGTEDVVTRLLAGGPAANIETDKGIVNFKILPNGQVSLNLPGSTDPKVVDESDIAAYIGPRAAAEYFGRRRSAMASLKDNVVSAVTRGELGSNATEMYERVQFGRYENFAKTVFGDKAKDMRSLAQKLANIDTMGMDEQSRVIESLTLHRMGGVGTQIGAAFAGTGTGVRVQDTEALIKLFGDEEKTAEAIRSAFGPGAKWGVGEIRSALKGEGRAKELKDLLGQSRIGMDLIDQILKREGVEYSVRKGQSKSDAIYVIDVTK